MNTPMTVPAIVPMPPNREVPPSTTAAMAWRLSVEWPPMVVVEKRARRQESGETRERPGQRVDLDQVPVHVDARAPRRLDVRADGVGVTAEPGPAQDHPEDQRDERGDHHEPGDLPEEPAGPDGVDERGRDGRAGRRRR